MHSISIINQTRISEIFSKHCFCLVFQFLYTINYMHLWILKREKNENDRPASWHEWCESNQVEIVKYHCLYAWIKSVLTYSADTIYNNISHLIDDFKLLIISIDDTWVHFIVSALDRIYYYYDWNGIVLKMHLQKNKFLRYYIWKKD